MNHYNQLPPARFVGHLFPQEVRHPHAIVRSTQIDDLLDDLLDVDVLPGLVDVVSKFDNLLLDSYSKRDLVRDDDLKLIDART